jgi:hypothetical protein
MLACPSFFSSPRRHSVQVVERLKTRLLLPQPRTGLIQAMRDRAAEFQRYPFSEVVTTCPCGACTVVCAQAGPRFTTVCHCTVCRGHNYKAGGAALAFAAVSRAACRLEVGPGGSGGEGRGDGGPAFSPSPATDTSPFVWHESSALSRRGRCSKCDGERERGAVGVFVS